MAGADDAAAQEQDRVEVDDAQGRLARDHAQPEEHHRHHDRDEEFEEPLDPEVDDPEPPGVDHREVRSGCRRRTPAGRRAEWRRRPPGRGARSRASPGPCVPGRPPAPGGRPRTPGPPPAATCHPRPSSRYSHPWCPNQNQSLPSHWLTPASSPTKAAQRPPPPATANRTWMRPAWPLGSRPPSDEARSRPPPTYAVAIQKMASCRCHVRRMLLGKTVGQVEAVEARRLDAEVRQRPAHQRLHQEEKRDDHEVLERGPLAGRRLAGQELRMDVPAPAAPSQVIEPAEGEEHRRGARQQGDEAQGAPDHRIARRPVADGRVVREVIGIRVILARHVRGRGPGGPREERHQLPQLLGVGDGLVGQAAAGPRAGEELAPPGHLEAERVGLGLRVLERVRGGVVTVLGQVVADHAHEGRPLRPP